MNIILFITFIVNPCSVIKSRLRVNPLMILVSTTLVTSPVYPSTTFVKSNSKFYITISKMRGLSKVLTPLATLFVLIVEIENIGSEGTPRNTG